MSPALQPKKTHPFQDITTEELERQARALRSHIPDLQSKLWHMTAEIKRRKKVRRAVVPSAST